LIRVCVVGAAGRMGSESVRALSAGSEFQVVAAIDSSAAGRRLSEVAGVSSDVVVSPSLDSVEGCDVLLEFTHAESATEHAVFAAMRGVAPVIGASGLSSSQQREVADACKKGGVGGILVPNFAIGAVLMMRFAAEAAKWLPNAEVIEMHHDKKLDAPSGTGIRTAELISEARKSTRNPDPTKVVKFEGARGALVDDVPVHSVRLPGLVAHQTVMFGGEGEVLKLHHDSMNRLSFMEGVKLAVHRVRELDSYVVGLDALMF
jgi:4-hydroxy-tetrahydrodipicolinate reductase